VIDNLRLGALLLPMSAGSGGRYLVEPFSSTGRAARRSGRSPVRRRATTAGDRPACVTEPRSCSATNRVWVIPGNDPGDLEAFRELNSTLGLSMLIVEQSARLALSVASYAYVLETGRIVWEGAPTALDNDSSLVAAYLGRTETKS